jgi:hypothetical protein
MATQPAMPESTVISSPTTLPAASPSAATNRSEAPSSLVRATETLAAL